MATRAGIADFIVAQLAGAGEVSARKMFGEYGVYCDGKMIALICDDQLFLKPTEAGRACYPDAEEGQPYPGARNWLLVPEDLWDDSAWLCELVRVTAREVPLPKKKKKA